MMIPDKIYNILKWIALILLPAIAFLYGCLGDIWGWPYVDAIVRSIAGIETFIGMLIGISTVNYNKEQGRD